MSEIKATHNDGLSRRELLERLSPFGKVKLDAAKCTGCCLCVTECSTGALTISTIDENGGFQLLFRQSRCMACSQCVEICPEKCLRMEHVLELEKTDSQSVLFEDTIVRCSGCGSPIGPRSMIAKLQTRVMAVGHSFSSQAELCPACRSRHSSIS